MRNEIAFGDTATVGLYAGALRDGSTAAAADRQVTLYNLIHADELKANFHRVEADRAAQAPHFMTPELAGMAALQGVMAGEAAERLTVAGLPEAE